ncbi:10468_t:CDS:2 [Entrophospora sp. SA101]|nr:10468_t:CDS:2 [Entrophospora sp. SA101]
MSERKEYQVFSRIHVNMRTTIILQDTGFAFTILQDIRTLNPPLAKNSFAKKNISDELRKETCIYAKKHSKQQSKALSHWVEQVLASAVVLNEKKIGSFRNR